MSWWNISQDITAKLNQVWNRAEIHMAVLYITQYEMVPAPDFPAPLATYQHYMRWIRARVAAFSQRFFKPC